jgi:hypothetical protein
MHGEIKVSDKEQRKNVQRYDTPDLQGSGSWVEVRLALIGESKAFMKESERLRRESLGVESGSEEAEALEAEASKLGEDWYSKNVLAWTWKDEDGNVLPLPRDNPDVLDKLTTPELQFLAAAINGSADDQKKQRRR